MSARPLRRSRRLTAEDESSGEFGKFDQVEVRVAHVHGSDPSVGAGAHHRTLHDRPRDGAQALDHAIERQARCADDPAVRKQLLDQALRSRLPPPSAFTSGLGVHNIHQNQGDPVGGGHDTENAIWQDGGTVVQTTEGEFYAFLNKFKTQSFKTDDFGHPV